MKNIVSAALQIFATSCTFLCLYVDYFFENNSFDDWYSFFIISRFPFLSTLQKYFVLQRSFPKIYQNVFPLIWDGLKTSSAFPLPSSPFSLLCWIAYFLYLLFTLIHPFSSPRSLVPGFIVPLSIVQYQQTVQWKRQKIGGISIKLILVNLQSIQSEAKPRSGLYASDPI